MCIKLSGNKRWVGAKYHMYDKYKISVHFSDRHTNYISAYRYITKVDKNVLLSVGHPDLELDISPKTSKANKSLMKKRCSHSGEGSSGTVAVKHSKSKRLSKVSVMDIIKSKNIKTETELFALASVQAEEGLIDSKVFIANTTAHAYNELIAKTWKLAGAVQQLVRNTQNRIERLVGFGESSCVDSCKDKLWLQMATQLLRTNRINKYVFAEAFRNLLSLGRGKTPQLVVGSTKLWQNIYVEPFDKNL